MEIVDFAPFISLTSDKSRLHILFSLFISRFDFFYRNLIHLMNLTFRGIQILLDNKKFF